jgi:alpha-amylase
MVVDVALYTYVHQPRRLKLPAQPVPRGASLEDLTRCLFDERLNERCFRQVAQSCYYPTVHLLLELVRLQGLRLAISFTLSFVRQAERWEPALLDLFRELVAEDGVEIVGADPYHSLHCLIDLPAFAVRMRAMADDIAHIFGKRPAVTDTTAMGMSAGLYHALDAAGFRGTFAEGGTRVLGWRSSNYLYRYDHEHSGSGSALTAPYVRWNSAPICAAPPPDILPVADSPCLLVRHQELSADVDLRFSDPAWSGYPLYADVYARWVAQAQGDIVLLGWDCETFGGRHAGSSGIFEFLQALPGELRRHGIVVRTPGELIDRYTAERVYHLPLPVQPFPLADAYGLDSISGSGPQRELFQLMRDIYNLARLTENPAVLDIANWLLQVDHLCLFPGTDAHFPTQVPPREWWNLGVHGLQRERRQVYLNALRAFEPYLATGLARRTRRLSPAWV